MRKKKSARKAAVRRPRQAAKQAAATNYGYRDEVVAHLAGGLLTHGFGRSSVPGTLTIEATLWSAPHPLATVWFQFVDAHTISIMGSYVPENRRRLGLRTFLHRKLIASYPQVNRIITCDGTDAGAAWMRSAGYKETAEGHWVFRIPKTFRAT